MGRPPTVPRRAARLCDFDHRDAASECQRKTVSRGQPCRHTRGSTWVLAAERELHHVPGMRALAYSLGLLATACSSRPDVLAARQLPASVKADAAQVVAANTQLAVALYHQLPGGNTIFSPFSISTAFAMLDAGAAQDTDSQLRQARSTCA
jgi:hypothetical protein